MINAIGGAGAPFPRPPLADTLTEDQRATVASILENYDPSSVSEDDAKAIFEALKEAGVPPGKGLKDAIAEAGFDAEALRKSAFGDRPPPGSKLGRAEGASISTAALQSLQSVLEQFDLANLSDDDKQRLMSALNDAGLLGSGSVIDVSA